MKSTELLDAEASTAGMTIAVGESGRHAPFARVVARTSESEAVASPILGTIHTERRAARIGRNRRTTGCKRQRRPDTETS